MVNSFANNLILNSTLYISGDSSLLSACVLIRTVHGKFEDVANSIRQLKGVQRIFPVLGRYDVVVDLEASDLKELNATVLRMGNFVGVVFTETLVEIQH
jgi:DNA-binding Lrp family transcriptional regulator